MAYTKQVSQLHGIIQYCLPPKPFFNHKPGECHLQFFLRMIVEHNLREDYGEIRQVMIVGFIRFNFFFQKSLCLLDILALKTERSHGRNWYCSELRTMQLVSGLERECAWHVSRILHAEILVCSKVFTCVWKKTTNSTLFFFLQQTGSVVSLLLEEKKNTEKPAKDWKKQPNLTILCNCLWDWEKLTNPTTHFQHDF